MKDSGIEWIGEIGENHILYKVKHIFDILDQYRSPITADKRNQEADILYDYYGASGAIDKIDGYTIDDHVMLIGEDGANLRMRNLPLIYEVNGKAWINNHAHILKPKCNMDFRFLFFALESLDINPYITGSAQPKLSQDNLKNMYIPVPPLAEQTAIAAHLDTQCAHIDSVIEKTKQSIEEYKKLKQAVITQAVTKGVRGEREMKDSGVEWIGEIPREWEISKIKYGVSKVGSGKTPRGGAETYADSGVLFLRSQNIYDTGLNLESPTYITEEVDEDMKSTRVQPNDVLLNITGGSIGRCCIFPNTISKANVNQHVSIIRVVDSVFTPEYMHYFWISAVGKTSISLYQTGGNREGMSADAIINTPIMMIPISEQNEITAYLDQKCAEIDTLITKKEQFLTELESYKKSMIYEYVTGKKEAEP